MRLNDDEKVCEVKHLFELIQKYNTVAVHERDFAKIIAQLLAVHDRFGRLSDEKKELGVSDMVDLLDEALRDMIEIFQISRPGLEIKMIRKDAQNDT